jgi:hypothetical protein
MKQVLAAAVSLGLVCGVMPGSGSASTQKDRALATALVFWHSKKCDQPPDQSMWTHGWRFNALFGNCRGGDGAEVFGLWRDDKTFAFMYVIYKPQDALCCPTGGGEIVRYKWNGRQFQALDRAPPRRTNTTAGR